MEDEFDMDVKRNYFMFSGKGKGNEKLLSFDNALLNAQVANYNHVKISSILPPHCISSNVIDIAKGSILFSAYASISRKGEGVISASIAVGIPEDSSDIGVIMEYSGLCTKEISEQKVIDMVVSAMKNRMIRIKEVKNMAIEEFLNDEYHSSVVAGIALW